VCRELASPSNIPYTTSNFYIATRMIFMAKKSGALFISKSARGADMRFFDVI
jgi:hypothetical protein